MATAKLRVQKGERLSYSGKTYEEGELVDVDEEHVEAIRERVARPLKLKSANSKSGASKSSSSKADDQTVNANTDDAKTSAKKS